MQYDRNPRSWQASDRSPARNTNRLVIGIVCAAAVFLSSTALLIGLGTPQDVAAILRTSNAVASPTDILSQGQPSVTADGTSLTTTPSEKTPGTTPSPGAPGAASPTPKSTAVFTATPSPTRTATPRPTATATPLPALLSVTPTSVDVGTCDTPTTTDVSVSNHGGSPMTWSLNTSGVASASLSGDTLGPGSSDPVTITWIAPVVTGSVIQFTANGSNTTVSVTVTCSSG